MWNGLRCCFPVLIFGEEVGSDVSFYIYMPAVHIVGLETVVKHAGLGYRLAFLPLSTCSFHKGVLRWTWSGLELDSCADTEYHPG